jgi:hypothetical protein
MFRRVGIFKAAPMFRAVFIVIGIIAVILTALILFYFWSWLNPVDFWQKLIAIIVSVISGIILFIVFAVVMSILILPLLLKRTMRKMMKKAFTPPKDDETGYM